MSIVNVKVKYIRPKYKNLKEWIDDNDSNVYIGRPGIVFIDGIRYPPQDKCNSLLYNPYKIGVDGDRDEIINKYKKKIKKLLKNDTDGTFKKLLKSLKGKNLGCWCKPEECHGDVLIKFINKLD